MDNTRHTVGSIGSTKHTLSSIGSSLSNRVHGTSKNDDSTASHIRVLVRVRPLNQSEISVNQGDNGNINVIYMDERRDQPCSELVVRFGSAQKRYAFDEIHGINSRNENVFHSVKDIVDSVVTGYNGCILAYGQTGSGKTHTVFGNSEGKNGDDSPAIMSQSLRELFEQLDQAIQTMKEQNETDDVHGIRSAKTECTASFYEILNEQIFDLLTPQSLDHALSIREDVGGAGVYVEGLREVHVPDPASALQLFRQGIANRHVASTKMNRTSSRSHAVFVLKVMSEITTYRGITKVKRSKLTVVDLAGSERQSKTGAVGSRLKEASQINKSLSTLGSVINALVDREAGKLRHVPFRDSKLTFLLRDSLGGNSKTCLIACVSPSGASLDETLSTLNFAQRAKLIKNVATVNEDTKDTINSLQAEVERLMTLLQEKQSGSFHQKNYSDAEIEKAVAAYKARAEQAEDKVRALNGELAEKQEDVKLLARKLNELTMVRSINEKSRFEISSGELDIQEQTLILQEELVMLLRQIDTPSRASAALKLKSMDDKDEISKIVRMEIARLDASSKALHKVKEVLEQRISEFMLSSNETQEEIDSLIKALNRLDGDIKMLEDKLDAKDKQYLEACNRAEKAEKEVFQLGSLVATLQKQASSPTSVVETSLSQIPTRRPYRPDRKGATSFSARDSEDDFAMLESQLDSELDVLKKQIGLY